MPLNSLPPSPGTDRRDDAPCRAGNAEAGRLQFLGMIRRRDDEENAAGYGRANKLLSSSSARALRGQFRLFGLAESIPAAGQPDRVRRETAFHGCRT